MASIKDGRATSEYLLTKYGAAIAAAAPVVAVIASKYLGVQVTAESVVELANNALIAIAAMASAYSIGRSIVKSRK